MINNCFYAEMHLSSITMKSLTDGSVYSTNTSEFFELLKSLNTGTHIYFMDLDKIYMIILKEFVKMGGHEAVKIKMPAELSERGYNEIEYINNDRDLLNKDYTIRFSGDNQCYTIKIKYGKHVHKFYDFNKVWRGSIPECSTPDECLKSIIETAKNPPFTIAGLCFNEFKRTFESDVWKSLFPNVYEIPARPEYAFDENGNFVRASCGDYLKEAFIPSFLYMNSDIKRQTVDDGIIFDINSLYPYTAVTFPLPVGYPKYFKGECNKEGVYKISRYKVCFEEKTGFNFLYQKDNIGGGHIKGTDGKEIELILTDTDKELLYQCYNVKSCKLIDGYYFYTKTGLFDEYINRYYEQKRTSTGGARKIAKLKINSLLGKFLSDPLRQKRRVYFDEFGRLKKDQYTYDYSGQAGYIPIGVAIVSYARQIIINACLAEKERLRYSDADSMHLSGHDIPDWLSVGDKIGQWKIEAMYNDAIYLSYKRYIYSIKEKGAVIKLAGMREKSASSLKERIDEAGLKNLNGLEYTETYTRLTDEGYKEYTRRDKIQL